MRLLKQKIRTSLFFIAGLLLYVSLFAGIVSAQWMLQNSGTGENLYDIEFLNKNTGWAVGDAGIVLKTTNAGKNWINIPNPSINYGGVMWSIQPIDSNIVYAEAGRDFIMKTTNAGNNWLVLNGRPNSITGFNDAYFLNKDTGWFLGGNKVFRTYNGGITMDSFYVPVFQNFEIHFKDMNTGIFCSEGYVYKTTNKGVNWYDTDVPTGPVKLFFKKLAIVDNQHVWIAGGKRVFRSDDFGDTWIETDTLEGHGAVGLEFVNQSTGYAGGGLYLYKTTDGGYNWIREYTSSPVYPLDIHFVDDTTGYVTGGFGKIFYTTTGGALTSITSDNSILPESYKLYQNYPNPFNPATNIKFDLAKNTDVKLIVYDMLGREIETLVNESLNTGSYSVNFNGSKYTSGIYFYKLIINGSVADTKKMMMVK